MVLRSFWAFAAVLALAPFVLGQEAPVQPEPMVDPLRKERVELLDAWKDLAERLHEDEDPRSKLLAAWALFHQFDVDYFTLLEGDGEELLGKYHRTAASWRKQFEVELPDEPLAQLAVRELNALLDDVQANRLQNVRPENLTGDAPEVKAWIDKFDRFQANRAESLQQRGKLALTLYREGRIDSVRLCVSLLERQIAERVLLEHTEMTSPPDMADEFLARRGTLLGKHRDEWRRLEQLLSESKAPSAIIDIGAKVCQLHIVTIDLLRARLKKPASGEAEQAQDNDRLTALANKVFTAYRELHRASATRRVGDKLQVEQLARIHDLRMYTTIWSDPALNRADVIADAIEVAEMWTNLSEQLAKTDPKSIDAQIARAKQLEAQITRDERQGPAVEPQEAEQEAKD